MDPLVQRMVLRSIETATPTVASSFLVNPDAFVIQLPYGPAIDGLLKHMPDTSLATIEHIEVPHQLHNHGIGTRLMQSFFRYCDENFVDTVKATFTSSEAIRVQNRVVGETAMHFIESVADVDIELPITVDQAAMSLDRVNSLIDEYEKRGEDIPDDFHGAFQVKVRMSDVDAQGWEMPVPGPLDTHTDYL